MSYALFWNKFMNPDTAGSISEPTAEAAAEDPSILSDPCISYGLDMETFLGENDPNEQRSWAHGVRAETSDEWECDDIYGSGEEDDDNIGGFATSNALETFAKRDDAEDTQQSTTSEFAAAAIEDQRLSKDSRFMPTQQIRTARSKVWQHETLPLYQEFVTRQVDPPSGERVSIEYNHATQFMLGGLQLAGNRTAASCEPCRDTDDQLPRQQTETLGCFTHMEGWARQTLLTHDIPDDQYDESVLYSLMMFAETFYEGFVHSTEQLLKESRARQAQRRSPILELQDFSFGVDVRLELTPPFHNLTSTRVFRTLGTTNVEKLKDLTRKVNFVTGKMEETKEEDAPRQTRESKAKAIRQVIEEQQLLGRVAKDPVTTPRSNHKQTATAPVRRSKRKDKTVLVTPDTESISTAPKRRGRPPKVARNAQPIRAISPTSAYRGGKGKNIALLDSSLGASAAPNDAMPPPPVPAPIQLHLTVPDGLRAEDHPASSSVSTSGADLPVALSASGSATAGSPHLLDTSSQQRRPFVPTNRAGAASASASSASVFVPYDYPTPTDSLPPSRDNSVLRMLDGEETAQQATPTTLTPPFPVPDPLVRGVSSAVADTDGTPKATPRRGKRQIKPTPKAEELMQTRARAKAEAGKKGARSPTKEVGVSTRSAGLLIEDAGPSVSMPQALGRKRKLVCMCAFWVHCASAVSKVSDAMRLLTAKQLALVVFSLPGLVVFSIMASTWTYLILMFGLSQPQGPSAAAQREYQQCNGYADFWRNNRTRIGWLGCSFLIPREATAAAAAPAEGAPSPPKTPSSDTDAAPDFKAGVDSDGVHKTEG
ncbi:hypothetical protein EYR40_004678 [Pleurotus pulmonarius]|nr:hypothetical protein EYR40_004678 [Pleurotus pulmonarius]